MRFERMFTVVDSHTAGECTRVVVSGIPPIPGKTMKEKIEYFNENLSYMRALVKEPREVVSTSSSMGAVVTPPVSKEADYGMFFLRNPAGACIHGTMGVATTLIECGMVQPVEPVTEVKLDTVWGLISARANLLNNKVESVTIRNVPCFLHTTLNIDLPKINKKNVQVDIAYGGIFFAYVFADEVGVLPVPENFLKLAETSKIISDAIKAELDRQGKIIQHPEMPERIWDGLVILYTHNSSCFAHPEIKGDLHAKQQSTVMSSEGIIGFDRSPCGTGTSGRLAQMYAYGLIKLDQEFINESMIGTYFRGKVVSETKVAKFDAVVPEITGNVWITAISTQVFDPTDPFKYGFPPNTHPYYFSKNNHSS